MIRTILSVGVLALLISLAMPARAELLGTSVTGTASFGAPGGANFFSPGNGFVPAGFGNSSPGTNVVTIAEPLIEFGYKDAANGISANFTDNTLTLSESNTISGANLPQFYTFTDTALAGLTLTQISNTFYAGGATAVLSGNTLTISIAQGGATSGQTYTASYSITPAASGVPLPPVASAGLLLAGLAFTFRRKLLCAA